MYTPVKFYTYPHSAAFNATCPVIDDQIQPSQLPGFHFHISLSCVNSICCKIEQTLSTSLHTDLLINVFNVAMLTACVRCIPT